jgi:hypothetical protein
MEYEELPESMQSELLKGRKFRTTTATYVVLASIGVLGTAIGYGRSVVTKQDMRDDIAPIYQRLDAADAKIETLETKLALVEGRLSADEGTVPDPPGHPARKTWAAKKKGASK